MSEYSQVQFVSWELYTGPEKAPNGQNVGYVGLNFNPITNDKRLDVYSQCLDIEARVLFTQDAINKAYEKASSDPKVLKVFMAPEFLYRGMGGAYIHDLLNGWESSPPPSLAFAEPFNQQWRGLLGKLQDFVADDKFSDWVFVFGTAVSASFPTMDVNVPGRDKPMCFINPSATAEGYNTSLIQSGGSANRANNYAAVKHLKSGIDFISAMINFAVHTDPNINHMGATLPMNRAIYDAMGTAEGGATFTLKNVNAGDGKPLEFGAEICLDHSWSYSTAGVVQNVGRLISSGRTVRIQLVPSGGMSLQEPSISLMTPASKSYAFNCDGLRNFAGQWGSHVQIWNGPGVAHQLVQADGGAAVALTQVIPVTQTITSALPQINNLQDTSLWAHGAGAVRVMSSYPL